jgi:hypothetical protein
VTENVQINPGWTNAGESSSTGTLNLSRSARCSEKKCAATQNQNESDTNNGTNSKIGWRLKGRRTKGDIVFAETMMALSTRPIDEELNRLHHPVVTEEEDEYEVSRF